MRERIRQFREASLLPGPDDYRLAKSILHREDWFDAFCRQEARDVRHAVETARWLMERDYDDRDLLLAALLHDIGKGRQRTRDRVAWVVADSVGMGNIVADEYSRTAVLQAMARTATHAETGAEVLERLGLPERVIDLTRLHHASAGSDVMLGALQAADAAS